ncbi:L-fucose kinase [Toxocara canis]|uniref:L-fucose kinase n=1 Tax=Toxocara canis TaxID=6265 RepID=A0A0B2VAQ2_TOXCA|nr:L-fucose kinase [Toxocara canis]
MAHRDCFESTFSEAQSSFWTLICVTTRDAEQRAAIEQEVEWLWRCGAIASERIIVVEDPCPDIGSGGSSLNALLVAAEHLCAQRGLSVLSEEVLLESRILIIHSGRECGLNRCGSAFMYLGKDTITKEGIRVPRSLFVLQLLQLTKLAAHFSNNSFAYVMDVIGIDYCSNKYGNDANVPLVLATFYMPIDIATTLLSLHSVYPLSSCTYYGIDNGSPGLQLSIFFDFIVAIANGTNEEDFVRERSPHDERSAKARQILFRRFSRYNAHACFLNITKYHYFQPADEQNVVVFWNTLTGNSYRNANEVKKELFLPALEDSSYAQLSLKSCFQLNR